MHAPGLGLGNLNALPTTVSLLRDLALHGAQSHSFIILEQPDSSGL